MADGASCPANHGRQLAPFRQDTGMTWNKA